MGVMSRSAWAPQAPECAHTGGWVTHIMGKHIKKIRNRKEGGKWEQVKKAFGSLSTVQCFWWWCRDYFLLGTLGKG